MNVLSREKFTLFWFHRLIEKITGWLIERVLRVIIMHSIEKTPLSRIIPILYFINTINK